MIKIAHIADLHISGAWMDRTSKALAMASEACKENSVTDVVYSGDIFERANIADRYGSVGTQQSVLIAFIMSLSRVRHHFIVGNHDRRGEQASALEFLREVPGCMVYDSPQVVDLDGYGVGFIPWIEKGLFVAKIGEGKSKSETDLAFSEAIESVLAKIKIGFKTVARKYGHEDCNISFLFGHCEVQGVNPNPGYTIQGGGYAFTEGQLRATGADYISLGHIHRRDGLYSGSLYQKNFGEEGNPQGIEIIGTTKGVGSNEDITQEFISLSLSGFETIEIKDTMSSILQPSNQEYFLKRIADGWTYKLRFYGESLYAICPRIITANCAVEKLWTKKDFVSRTEKILSPMMSDTELLREYIAINFPPEGLTEADILEVI